MRFTLTKTSDECFKERIVIMNLKQLIDLLHYYLSLSRGLILKVKWSIEEREYIYEIEVYNDYRE